MSRNIDSAPHLRPSADGAATRHSTHTPSSAGNDLKMAAPLFHYAPHMMESDAPSALGAGGRSQLQVARQSLRLQPGPLTPGHLNGMQRKPDRETK